MPRLSPPSFRFGIFVTLSVLVLGVCLFYTYASLYLVPQPGFLFDTNWVVERVFTCDSETAACLANNGLLQPNDRIVQIGAMTLEEFQHDRTLVAFQGYGTNATVPITFVRDDMEQTIPWQIVGPSLQEQMARVQAVLLYLPFWLAGTVAMFLLRPRDFRWRLFIWFNYTFALWLATGSVSYLHVAYASPIQRALAWLFIPICLNFHLMIPTPLLVRHSRRILLALYTVGGVLALMELAQILPSELYWIGMLLGIGGSLGLLLARFFIKNAACNRLALRLMVGGIVIAFVPALVFGLVPYVFDISPAYNQAVNFAVLTIPALPFFYLYAFYKRSLGNLEFRANQLLSRYTFALFYLTGLGVLMSLAGSQLNMTPTGFVCIFFIAALFVVASPYLTEHFQHWFDRLAYGMHYEPDQIIRALANQIPSLLDRSDLAFILEKEVAPSLLIRESALYVLSNGGAELFYKDGVTVNAVLEPGPTLARLTSLQGEYRPPQTVSTGEWGWVRLAIELRVRELAVGIWLFGRRDPDDFYPASDIAMLKMLGNQVAVALENIRLFANQSAIASENARLFAAAQQEIQERKRTEETLKVYSERLELLSRQLVQAQETERQRLASDLHDSVVQWLSGTLFRVEATRQLINKANPDQARQELDEIEAGLKHSIYELRSTIVRLHPPELEAQGLGPALQQYVKRWRAQTKINATVEVLGKHHAFPLAVETGLYRICQEALNNVAKHAHATVTNIDLAYAPEGVSLSIQDNGVGFQINSENGENATPENESTGALSHFGLFGIAGRAKNIGGQLKINSKPNKGTTILVTVPANAT